MTAGAELIYIGPFGFSGSTLLDVALAQAPGTVTLGEAFQIADWMRHDRLCTCREPLSRCAVWPHWLDGLTAAQLARPAALSKRHDYLSSPAPDAPEVLAYARRHWALIDRAAEAAGARVVIDSSKHLWRLRALARLHPERIRFVHLVRDCGPVARSATKVKARPAEGAGAVTEAVPYPRSVAKWIACNAAAARFCRRHGVARRVVAYRRLTAEPREVLGGLCDWLGLDWTEAMCEPSVEGLHNIAGSRWRMTRRRVRFEAGDAEAGPWTDRAVSAVASRLAGI